MSLIVNGTEIENLIVVSRATGESTEIELFQDSLGNVIFKKTTETEKIVDQNIHKFVVRAVTFVPESDTTITQTTGISLVFDSAYSSVCTVDWGDGTSDSINSTTATTYNHIYPTFGVGETKDYTVTVTGTCESMTVNSAYNGGRGYWSGDSSSYSDFNAWTYTTLIDVIGINNTAKTLASLFANAWIAEGTIFTLPKIVAPNCVSMNMFMQYADTKTDQTGRKNGTVIIPDECFVGIPNCTDFSYCFSQGRNYDDGSVVSQLTIELGRNIFPQSATTLPFCFNGCKIISAIPEDFLYSLVNITDMSYMFRAVDNTGFTLPTRWLPSNMSNVTTMRGFMAVNSDDGDDGSTPVVVYPLFYGTMENVWDRTDLNAELITTNAFKDATTLDNYNEIPSSWGGGGA